VLDDTLLRIFAGDRVRAIMDRLKMPEGEPIEAGIVSRSIESAQRKVEARNFDIRKQLLEYDDVANDQRKVIYTQRNELLEATDISELIASLRAGTFTDVVRTYVPAESVEEQWDIKSLQSVLANEWALDVPLEQMLVDEPNLNDDDILEKVLAAADASYNAKIAIVGKESFGGFERNVMLQSVDTHWREHLAALDHLRQGIHLRGYAQKNPKQEYKREAFELFGSMLDQIKNEVIRTVMTVRIQSREEVEAAEAAWRRRRRTWKTSTTSTPTSTRRPRRKNCWRRSPIRAARRCGRRPQHLHGCEGRPQRSLPLRQRQEVQGLPRQCCPVSNCARRRPRWPRAPSGGWRSPCSARPT
jgi:preprotein translocase subunit SecA